jgi:catechol 2,3-dioxygenase-like lactoylglutathione lyase family enzyme
MFDPVLAHAGVGVHSIDHFALNVPSIEEAAHFFRAFGLDVATADAEDQELEIRAADGHRWARILPASTKCLAWLSFNCFETDLDTLRAQMHAACAVIEAGPVPAPEGFWFRDPDGNS